MRQCSEQATPHRLRTFGSSLQFSCQSYYSRISCLALFFISIRIPLGTCQNVPDKNRLLPSFSSRSRGGPSARASVSNARNAPTEFDLGARSARTTRRFPLAFIHTRTAHWHSAALLPSPSRPPARPTPPSISPPDEPPPCLSAPPPSFALSLSLFRSFASVGKRYERRTTEE